VVGGGGTNAAPTPLEIPMSKLSIRQLIILVRGFSNAMIAEVKLPQTLKAKPPERLSLRS